MKIGRTMSLAAVLALAPLAWSPGEGLRASEACGFADCCSEQGSTCVKDGKVTENAYYTSGSCPGAGTEAPEFAN